MTPVRCIRPGQVCFVTAEAIGRLFRLAPSPKVRQITDFCLRAAAEKFEGKIKLHEFQFLSNHLHLLLTDVAGCLPDFMSLLHSLITRNLNAIRGITGRNFEGYSFQVIDPDDRERLVNAAVYVLCNAVEAHRVSRTKHWKATSSHALAYGKASSMKKPALGIWSGKQRHLDRKASTRSGRAAYARASKIPDVASLTLHPLPGFKPGEVPELRRTVLDRVRHREDQLIVQRRREGTQVAGMRMAERVDYNASPQTVRELFDRNPTFAASTPERRAAALERRKEFEAAYYAARDAFIAGKRDVVFPHGTWRMVRILKARCASAPPS